MKDQIEEIRDALEARGILASTFEEEGIPGRGLIVDAGGDRRIVMTMQWE